MIEWLFGMSGEVSRGQAMLWRTDLLMLHAASDAVIAISFFTIALGIAWYMRHRHGLFREYRTVAWLFCAFIFAAALSTLLGLIALRYPIHGLHGLAKGATALFSAAAVILIWPLLPALTGMPSARQLTEANDRLRSEAAAHEATLRELEASRQELETRVDDRTRELSIAKARFETALHGAKVYVFSQDRDLKYTWMYGALDDAATAAMIGRTDSEILPQRDRERVIALKRRVLATGETGDCEVSAVVPDREALFALHIDPTFAGDGTIDGIMCAAMDITARKSSEVHLREIMRELTHRSKNLLAVIQGMARQTARHSGTFDGFLDQFSARLQALSASHDLLVQESWHGASIAELIRSQLGPYIDRENSQILLDGPAALLKPEAAQSLGLAIHELAVNAAKYGGLSVAAGRVSIAWRELPAADGGGIEIVWVESGGPSVAAPERRGFGSLAVERHLARSLDGDVTLEFPPGGARCRMQIPAKNLALA